MKVRIIEAKRLFVTLVIALAMTISGIPFGAGSLGSSTAQAAPSARTSASFLARHAHRIVIPSKHKRKARVKPKAKAKPKKRATPKPRPDINAGPWQTAKVSWYGPGFYGRKMANGQRLQKDSMVVAHKTMKFGTKIQFSYKGKSAIAVVSDRGPYVRGREFDLGPGTAKALGFGGVDYVAYRILK